MNKDQCGGKPQHNNIEKLDIRSRERKAARRQGGRIKREVIHRYPLGSNLEGLAMLMFKSFDGMAPWKTRNEKISQGRKFTRRIQVDIYYRLEPRAYRAKIGHDCQL